MTLLLAAVALLASAAAPNGSGTYYKNANGKKGAELKTALCRILYDSRNNPSLSYGDLWNAFYTTDVRDGNKVWDMYSNMTLTLGTNQDTGSGNAEGQYYNREHSFPQSWFGSNTPMYTDLHHIYPTDKFVNGKRSNYPFGETDGEDYKSANNFSKLGACTYSGYSGKVFEPNDEYKGDFARTYFYMVTCYEEKLQDWYNGNADGVRATIDGSTYPAFQNWQLNMLMEWATADPVSEKEINRNNAVADIQGNRNPFIDYPGLEQYIWGKKTDVAFDYDDYDGSSSGSGGDPDPGTDPSGSSYFTKITSMSDFEDGGTYLIVYETGGKAFNGALTTLDAVNNNISVTISDHKIEATTSIMASTFTIASKTGGYSIKSASGYYIGNTAKSNGLKCSTSDSYSNEIAFNVKGNVYIQSSSTYLYFNKSVDQSRFRYFTSSQQDIQLYKLVESTTPSPTPSDLALTGAPVTLSFDLYNNASAQTVSYTTSGTGAVTVSGGDGYVTTSVDASTKTITVTPTAVTPSAQTITVSQAADATHEAGSTTFTVSVSDSTPIESSVFVRVNDMKCLVDGAKVVIAARFNKSQANGYYAMTATTSGKPAGVVFSSVSSGIDETLPAKILNSIDTYCWTLGVTADGSTTSYTFTNASNQKLGYSGSGTDFQSNSNTAWSIVRATAGSSAMVGGYEGFYIINKSTTSRGLALNNSYNYGAYATSNNNGTGYNFYVDIFVEVESVSVSSAGYTTYVAKQNISFPDDVTAYISTSKTNTALVLTEKASVPANTPVILRGNEGTCYLPVIATTPENVTGNLLLASDGSIQGGNGIYALSSQGGEVGFYPVNDGVTIPAGKAYLDLGDSEVKGFTFVFEDEETGIKDLKDFKDFRDSKVIYNLAGQMVNGKLPKGIYIVNGKKVLK